MPVVTRFRVNQRGMDELLRSRRGPVVLHQANLGRRVAANARRLAPRGKGDGPHLANNIDSKLVPGRRGSYDVEVTANVPHALYVVKGTRPHSIGSPVLVAPDTWRYIGLSPAGKGRIHPGTKPNDFMYRAAEMEGLTVRRR
jgi:hypothetical protein